MKTTTNSVISIFGRFPGMGAWALATTFGLAALTARGQTQDFWQGTNGGDFNVATNWNLTVVPASGYSANNQTGTNIVGVISANDPSLTFNGFRLGNAGSGAFLQSGSTVTLGAGYSGWLRMGQNSPYLGVFTIESNAVLNSPFGATVGESGSAILNIWGGTSTFGNQFIVNDSPGGSGQSGTLNQTNGTVICNTQAWIGQGAQGQQGVFNMSGGFFGCTNWFVLGRSGGAGTLNMTGGSLNAGGSGGYLDVGTGYQGNGVGILNQSGGTITIVGNGQFVCPETAGGTGTYNLSGTGALFCNTWLAIGRGGPGMLNMSGGIIAKTDTGSDHIDIGAGGSSGNAGTGTVMQTGGIITNTTTDVWLGEVANGNWTFSGGTNYFANLVICEGSGIASTFTLNGGFLSVASIYSAQPQSSSAGLILNGGTIQARGSSAGFINNLSYAYLQTGGVVFDSQGYGITIPQSLASAASPDGGVTKVGGGSLTLTGANSYNGPTIVAAGSLGTTTASSGGGSFTVSNGASLTIQAASANGQLTATSVTFGGPAATLTIDLNNFGNPTAAPLNAGTLTAGGTVTVDVLDSVPAVGTIPLVQYAVPASGSFVLGALPSGVTAHLSNDVVNGFLDLIVTSAGAPAWNGTEAGGYWDINTSTNWIDLATGLVETYRDGEPVVFNDNAQGTTVVDLVTTVNPGSVTVNNNILPYTFVGPGKISGSTDLLKEGTSSLSLFNTGTNSYTGPTVIVGGSVLVSNLSELGASSASPTNLVLGGTLSYFGPPATNARGFDVLGTNAVIDAETSFTLSGSVAVLPTNGGSAFIKAGPAVFALTTMGTNEFANAFDPGIQVQNGTMVLNGSAGGQTNHTVNEMWVGDTPNYAAALILTNTTLYVDSWLGLSRGNGTSNFTSTMTMYNSTASFGNVSLGYDNGIAGNLAQPILTLNGTSTLIDNGVMNLSESGGSTGTIYVNGNSVISGGNQPFYVGIGANGDGTANGNLIISNSGVVNWNTNGNTYWFDIGNNGGVGYLLIANNGILATEGDFNVTDTGACTGTALVQDNGKLYANNLYIAKSAGALATFTISNNAAVYSSNGITIANNASATGTVNLAGGSLAVNLVQGFSSGTPTGTFNFAGGTLIAHGPYFGNFMYNLAAANVMSAGGTINVGGNTIQITQPLLNGGGSGGLAIMGGGTLYLNGANTYTGTTTVGTGTTLGGSGVLSGPVMVASGATIAPDAGTIGTFTINSNLTLAAGSTTFIKVTPSANDEVEGLTGVTYGGALIVTNTSSNALTVGHVYQLFNSAYPGTNNFSSVTVQPSGAASFNPATGTLTIASPTPVTLGAPVLSGGNLIVTGSGGAPGSGYTLLTTTNLALALSAWTTNTTGTFSGSGSFSNSIPVTTNQEARFFILRQP